MNCPECKRTFGIQKRMQDILSEVESLQVYTEQFPDTTLKPTRRDYKANLQWMAKGVRSILAKYVYRTSNGR